MHLSDLGAAPLDVLALSRASAQGGRSELDDRIIYQAVPAGAADVSVSYPAVESPAAGFADLLTVARAVADLIAGARALAPDDPAPALAMLEAAFGKGLLVLPRFTRLRAAPPATPAAEG